MCRLCRLGILTQQYLKKKVECRLGWTYWFYYIYLDFSIEKLNNHKIYTKLKTPPSALFSIPDELVESDKLEKIEQICEKLKILDDRELNIIYNIVNNAFK